MRTSGAPPPPPEPESSDRWRSTSISTPTSWSPGATRPAPVPRRPCTWWPGAATTTTSSGIRATGGIGGISVADDSGVPDSTNWSQWTYAHMLAAITGDKLDDLRSKLKDVQWLQFDKDAVGKSKEKAPDGNYIGGYYAFGKWVFAVKLNWDAVRAYEDLLYQTSVVFSDLSKGNRGALNKFTLSDLQNEVGDLSRFLSRRAGDYRQRANSLKSSASDFKGKAAAVIGEKLDHFADMLEYWKHQVDHNYGMSVAQAAHDAYVEIENFIYRMTSVWSFYNGASAIPLTEYIRRMIRIINEYMDAAGIVKGTPNYKFDVTHQDFDGDGNTIQVGMSKGTAEGLIDAAMRSYPYGDLRSATTWEAMNRAISTEAGEWIDNVDSAVRKALPPLSEAYVTLGKTLNPLGNPPPFHGTAGTNGYGGLNGPPFSMNMPPFSMNMPPFNFNMPGLNMNGFGSGMNMPGLGMNMPPFNFNMPGFDPGGFGAGMNMPGFDPGGSGAGMNMPGFDPGGSGAGMNMPGFGGAGELGANGELLGPNGQPLRGPNGELLGPDGQPLRGPNGELLGPGGRPLRGPNGELLGPDGQPLLGPNGELLGPGGAPVLGANGELLGPDGQPLLGPNGELLTPMVGPAVARRQLLDRNGEPLLGPNGELLGPDGQPLTGPNGELLGPGGGPLLGANGELLGPGGGPLTGPNGELLGPGGGPLLGANGELLGPGGGPLTGPNGELLGPGGGPLLGANGELLGP